MFLIRHLVVFFLVVLWPLVSWYEIVACFVCRMSLFVYSLLVCSRIEPQDQMIKCCPLDRFRRWFDISTDATPTFLEHTMHLVLPDAKGNKAEIRMEESKA